MPDTHVLFYRVPFPIYVIITPLLLLACVKQGMLADDTSFGLGQLAILVLALAAMVASDMLIHLYGGRVYRWSVWEFGLHVVQLTITAGTVFIGIFAHWFKIKNLRLYGWVEVLFAICAAFSVSSGISADRLLLSQWATLVGCSYVVARP